MPSQKIANQVLSLFYKIHNIFSSGNSANLSIIIVLETAKLNSFADYNNDLKYNSADYI